MVFRPKSNALDRLTATAIRNETTPGFYHDGGGLYLQVSRFNSKNWIYRFTIHGRTRDMGLGAVAVWPLAKVRERVRTLRQLVSQKIDPIEQQKKQRETAARLIDKEKTFKWCAQECHTRLLPSWKNVKHGRQWISTLERHVFPTFGEHVIADVGRREIAAVIGPMWLDTRETARRVLGRIREVLEWAAAHDYYPTYSLEMWEEIAKLLPVGRAQKRVRMASCPYPEGGRLLTQLKATTLSELLKLAFEFNVLTAVRPAEARNVLKSEIDLKERMWVIPEARMKMDKSHAVPLSEQVMNLLEMAYALNGGSRYVFPNLNSDKPFSDQAFTKVALRETLKVSYTMHGFRATFRTWAGETTTYPKEVCEFALAHNTMSDVEAAYARTTHVAQRRALMQDWADYLDATAHDAPMMHGDHAFN